MICIESDFVIHLYYTLFVVLLNHSCLVTVSEFHVTILLISDFAISKSDVMVYLLLRIGSICEVNINLLLYLIKGKSCNPSIINCCWYHREKQQIILLA